MARSCLRLAFGLAASLWLALILHAQPAVAQDFPVKSKVITIIVPYAAGGVTDTGARLMAAALEKELGVSVQVVNKVGAASQIGLTELVQSAPDGYTLSYAVLPTVTTHYLDRSRQAIYKRMSFQPVAMHHYVPQVLAVRADGPFKTLKDLIEAARAKPESIRVSDSGLMAVPHSQVLMLQKAAGVRFASVHFNGGAPSVTALLGSHVEALAGATADALPHLKSGAFRVLAIAANEPHNSMPEVPTMKSLGYDVQAASWTGIVTAAGLPPSALARLTGAIKKVIESPEHQGKLEAMSLSARYLDPDAYSKLWIEIEQRMEPLLESLAK